MLASATTHDFNPSAKQVLYLVYSFFLDLPPRQRFLYPMVKPCTQCIAHSESPWSADHCACSSRLAANLGCPFLCHEFLALFRAVEVVLDSLRT